MSSISALAGGGLSPASLLSRTSTVLPQPIDVAPQGLPAPALPPGQPHQVQKAVQASGEVSRVEQDKPWQVDAAPKAEAAARLSSSGQGWAHFGTPPVPSAEGPAGSHHMFDYLKGMVNDMQEQFSAVKAAIKEAPPTYSDPDVQQIGQATQKMMQVQETLMELQVGMGVTQNLQSTGKAVLDKVANQQG